MLLLVVKMIVRRSSNSYNHPVSYSVIITVICLSALEISAAPDKQIVGPSFNRPDKPRNNSANVSNNYNDYNNRPSPPSSSSSINFQRNGNSNWGNNRYTTTQQGDRNRRNPERNGGLMDQYPNTNYGGNRFPDRNTDRYPDRNRERHPDRNNDRNPDMNTDTGRYPDRNNDRYPDRNRDRYPGNNNNDQSQPELACSRCSRCKSGYCKSQGSGQNSCC